MNMKKANKSKSKIFYNFIISYFFYKKKLENYIKAIEWDNKFILYTKSRFSG